ncbi:MAG: hypothetical protein N0E45_20105, partial [Candidatus Thiodiazotropha endolucinida]|nr:hypothetical protein [Candidatus Thiodiazotropha taylori]MCW4301938.1 hypothetical protein [Candidatus Thiodiazotropha endolucinida]
EAGAWTRELVDLALVQGGTYYLTYQGFPTLEQFQRAYPKWEEFMRVKCKYDPYEVFTSKFYVKYPKAAYNQRMQKGCQTTCPSLISGRGEVCPES